MCVCTLFKKQNPRLLVVTSANINRFSKLFNLQIPKEALHGAGSGAHVFGVPYSV